MIRNVPDGWQIKKFSEVFKDDTAKKKKIPTNDYLELGDIPVIDQGKKLITGYTNDDKALNEDQPIIIFGDHTRALKYIDFNFAIGADGIKVLKNIEKSSNTKYLYYTLLNSYIPNTGYNRHFQYVKRLEIPIPPLPQQEKIVKVLDISSQLIEKQKELIKEYDLFLKSKFIEMFGDPIKNPMEWEIVSCIDVADCIVPGRDKPKSFTGYTPWITTNDLQHKGVIYNSKSNIGLSNSEISDVRAKIIPKDSVIFTCVGDLGVVSITKENIIMNQQLHSFQCKNSINNYFLMFNISQQKPYMYKMATSTTVPYMNKTTCNNIPTILPPIELQEKFASIVEKIEAIKIQETQKLKHLETLHKSLVDKAFKGEIV